MADKVHPTTIDGKSVEQVAHQVAALRYDYLALFVQCLSREITAQAEADAARGRHGLSALLDRLAADLAAAGTATEVVFEFCAPYMQEEIRATARAGLAGNRNAAAPQGPLLTPPPPRP